MDKIESMVKEEKTKEYGDAVQSMESCARFWNLGLRRMGWSRETDLTAVEACELMLLFKLSRNLGIVKQDNITDIQGYGLIMDLINNKDNKKVPA